MAVLSQDLGKFQAPNPKFQINSNDPNSKFQTSGSASTLPNRIKTGCFGLAKPYNTALVNVLVIGYCYLEFICNLVLEIWKFITPEL
jgi:hypothetical protein